MTHRTRRGALLCGIAIIATLVAGPAVTARAQNAPTVQHNPRGKFLGVVPNARAAAAARTAATPPLTYHGGPVQHSSKSFAIFWAPPGTYIPPSYVATIDQYFTDVAHDSFKTSNVYATDTQYYDIVGGVKHFTSYDTTFGGPIFANNALPANGCPNYTLGNGLNSKACLTDAQLINEINTVISAHALPTGMGSQFFLFTPPLIASCFASNSLASGGCYDPQSFSGYCAYHSNTGASPARLYANMPWADLSGCLGTSHGPNGDSADPTINVTSHEHNETMTDPLGSAWFDSSGFENGDECAWQFGPLGNNDVGPFNQVINGHDYFLQMEWSNRANSCQQKNTSAQPTGAFTFTPTTPAHGTVVTFTTTVSDTDDTTFTYSWTFGDGATSTVKNPTHTYATAGTKTATLVIFDAKGDQVRVVHAVPVH